MNKHIIGGEEAREQIINVIKSLNLEKRWEIRIEPVRMTRTRNQNALYWAWVEEIAKHVSEYTGYEKDDIHEYFKKRFLPGTVIEIDGTAVVRYTTTKLTTKQMADYSDRIYRWATSELGLVLPLPPTQTEERG